LIPKKHKDILLKLIEEKKYDRSFAEDAVSFFWSELRKNLSELSSGSITVRRLGIFQIKEWKIEEFIASYLLSGNSSIAGKWKNSITISNVCIRK
jgi:hypothetical protein